jgi:1-deoxy-D-xylulose-5-phosphate reductoisomerase
MQLPIAYALVDDIQKNILPKVDLLEVGQLEFKKIEQSRYPIWQIKDELLNNENLGVVLNAANEVAVQRFLEAKIGFLDISKISLDAINRFHQVKINTIDDIFEIDKQIRASL